jgi:2-aminobenzoylacetyl-CoA thioesterase
MMVASTFPKQLSSHLWLLGHTCFNLYLARGEKLSALIEIGVSAIADVVISQLELLNVCPDFLIVMHPHGDHINGLAALRERFHNARVICGAGAAEFISHPRTAYALVNDDNHMTSFMARQGISVNRPAITGAPSLNGALIHNDGDVLDLGDCTLHFSVVRGHAPGALVVHIPNDDAFMVSDALGFYYPGRRFFPTYFTGYADYITALDQLEAGKTEILGIAHHGPLVGRPDIKKGFQLARRCAMDMRELIRNTHKNDEQLIQDIYNDFYCDEMLLYTRENIIGCCKLLIKRSRES